LVEDNPVNVMVVSKYLERWGVDFDVAENGLEAMKKVTQQEYKLVLMDLHMPYMNGYEATAEIRKLADVKYKDLPIVALSASTRYDNRERIKSSGINDFVSKPFDAHDLKTKIAFYSQPNRINRPLEDIDAPESAPLVNSTTHAALVFNLDTISKMLKHKEADLEKLIRMTISSFEDCKIEFPAMLRAGSLEEYKFSTHKIKMTVDLFHAQRLQAAIAAGKNLLSNEVTEMSSIEEAAQVISQEFDTVIAGLHDALQSRTQVAGS
jgi:CheY-like chemotaxis protein